MDQINSKTQANQAVFRPFLQVANSMTSPSPIHTWLIRRDSRRPGLVILGTAAVAFFAGFRYKAASYEKNERAQKSSGLYVSVDRSGGGI